MTKLDEIEEDFKNANSRWWKEEYGDLLIRAARQLGAAVRERESYSISKARVDKGMMDRDVLELSRDGRMNPALSRTRSPRRMDVKTIDEIVIAKKTSEFWGLETEVEYHATQIFWSNGEHYFAIKGLGELPTILFNRKKS